MQLTFLMQIVNAYNLYLLMNSSYKLIMFKQITIV